MSAIWNDFKAKGVPTDLVDRLEKAYVDLKENFYLGKHKPAELEGGHLAEIVIRILQWATGGIGGDPYTPLGKQLPRFDLEVKRLEGLPGTFSKSLRVHIPRVLLSMYDIRNGRGVGHPGHEVDPNLADSTFVATAADWVIAELLRLYHGMPLSEAQAVVDGLVQRKAPIVQMFGTFPKVLRTDLSNAAKALVILYGRGGLGATCDELAAWLRVEKKEARRILRRHDTATLVHFDEQSDRGQITRTGIAEAERRFALRGMI